MKWDKKYCFELPYLDKEFHLSYFMYKINGMVYILPEYIKIDTTFAKIICRLLFRNCVLGDVYKLSVSGGLMGKKDKIFKKYISPILDDYSKKNNIELNYDFY